MFHGQTDGRSTKLTIGRTDGRSDGGRDGQTVDWTLIGNGLWPLSHFVADGLIVIFVTVAFVTIVFVTVFVTVVFVTVGLSMVV